MPKIYNTSKNVISVFCKKYGFDIGHSILVLPENDGRAKHHFSKEEFQDLLDRAEHAIIKSAWGAYGTISKNGIEGPFYKHIEIECESGRIFVCHPMYYRLHRIEQPKKEKKIIIPPKLKKKFKR